MNLWRWVDPRIHSVRVADVRLYLLGRGWQLKPYPGPELLVFEGPPDDFGKPIIQVLPASEQASDYSQRLLELITALSVIEDRHAVDVLNDILNPARHDQPSSPDGQGRTAETAAPALEARPRKRKKRG
jgi:hypothetical protein